MTNTASPLPGAAQGPLHFASPALSPARVPIPLFSVAIRAGFPSPAADFLERRLDLNDLIPHPEATYYAWAEGDSMTGLGIQDGDLLVVDKAVLPDLGDISVVEISGEFTVKRLDLVDGRPHLVAGNPAYAPIPVPPEGVQVWGVVIRVIHNPRPRRRRRQL